MPDEAAVLGGREDVARGHRHEQRLDVNVFAVNRGACIKGTIWTTLESIFLYAIIWKFKNMKKKQEQRENKSFEMKGPSDKQSLILSSPMLLQRMRPYGFMLSSFLVARTQCSPLEAMQRMLLTCFWYLSLVWKKNNSFVHTTHRQKHIPINLPMTILNELYS